MSDTCQHVSNMSGYKSKTLDFESPFFFSLFPPWSTDRPGCCEGKHTVSLVLVVTQEETVGLTTETLKKPKHLSACAREERGRHPQDVGRVMCACVTKEHKRLREALQK